MAKKRMLRIQFMDGSKVTFEFPEQSANEMARALKIEQLVKSPYVMVMAEGVLLMYPVANIKSIQVAVHGQKPSDFKLPPQAILGARIAD